MPAPAPRLARRLVPLLLLAANAACVSVAATTSDAPAPSAPSAGAGAGEAALPSIRWTRSSAEHRAIFLQTYRMATEELERRAAGRAAGSWGVILDADETVIDNAQYQQERARAGLPYSDESWNDWVRREAATALPGAAEFVASVRALGGRAVIVTNRDAVVCDATRANLRALGIAVDAVLCREPGPSDKNPRFRAVASGSAPSPLPPLEVVMWVGDNVGDFPGQTQAIREGPDAAFAEFGRAWVVLPNPMYGSWERNPLP